ncbi:MAG: putative ABC transport system permease protein [Rhodothermales bacterium]
MNLRFCQLYFRRFSLRHARRSPFGTLALLAIVALGVAVFFSVRLANRAAVSGFELFTTVVSGEPDFTLNTAFGPVPVAELPRLRQALGELPVHLIPLLEGTATVTNPNADESSLNADQLTVVGVDLLAVRNLFYARDGASPLTPAQTSPKNAQLGVSEGAFITRALATSRNLNEGDRFPVIIGDRPVALRVQGVVDPSELQPGEKRPLIIMDLPALQALMGQPDVVDRVEVVVPQGKQQESILAAIPDRLRAFEAEGWQIQASGEARESAATMSAAFQMNLSILSALSVVVGLYLILQAMEAAVVRRRAEIGILLSLGVEPRWIQRAWWVETAALGFVGSGLGLLLGWGMAQLTVRAIAQTVNALYVNTTATAAAWHHGEAALAFGIGFTACLAAGFLPARDAARSQPAQTMRQGVRTPGIKLLDHPAWGLGLLMFGGVFSQLPAIVLASGINFPLAGYLAAVCWLLAIAILSGQLFRFVPIVFRGWSARSAAGRVAISRFLAPTGRHKLTTAGLVVAVGMAAGMDILIHSFERTVTSWIGRSLQADVYVAVRGVENASNRNKISETTWQELLAHPGVESADIGHISPIIIQGMPSFLAGLRTGSSDFRDNLVWVEKPSEKAASDWFGTPVLVSESFSNRYRLNRGESLTIRVGGKDRKLEIEAVFADYGNERGAIIADGETVTGWTGDRRALNFAARLKPGVEVEALVAEWGRTYPALAVRSNRDLREEVLRIFAQTFSVTYALKAIGIFVAVTGLGLALLSLLIERRRELITLRELGFRRKELAASLRAEGLLMTVCGLIGGLTLSLMLGYLLIFVINKQSFGWTLAYAIPVRGLLLLSAGILVTAGLTAEAIGRWGARLPGEKEE